MDNLREAKTKLAAVNKDIVSFINSFVDDKSFVETDAFMSAENDVADAPGEGVVSGFAQINGVGVCIYETNPAVLKGSVGALNAKKITRAINNAVRMNKPLIAVWDSAGARFSEGAECLEGYGSLLRAHTVAYGEVPVITILKGNNLGLSAYVSGISDFVIALDGAVSATASPLVISAKTGCKQVGTSELLFKNGIATNVEKKDVKKTLIRMLEVFYGGKSQDDPNRVSKGLSAASPLKTVIDEVFDKNSFLPVRDGFAPEATTGFARLGDISVGVVATDGKTADGRLSKDGCVKISEFLNICENAETPVVFLTDCAGTEISADDGGLLREMSNLIYRVNMLSLDTFAVVYGKAVGAAYTAFVSPCDYKIAWDSAYIGALDGIQTARLLYADEIKTAKNKDKAAEKLAKAYAEDGGSAITAARAGYFDIVTEPALTRSYLIAALYAHLER